jgi:hypothetical protein
VNLAVTKLCHGASFLEAVMGNGLWWEIIGVDKQGVYVVVPLLTATPPLANLVTKGDYVRALYKSNHTLRELSNEALAILFLDTYPSCEVGEVIYYNLKDLPTGIGLVPSLKL